MNEYKHKVESGIPIPEPDSNKSEMRKTDWVSIADRMKHLDSIGDLTWGESECLQRAIKNKFLTTVKRTESRYKYRVWKIKIER